MSLISSRAEIGCKRGKTRDEEGRGGKTREARLFQIKMG